MVAVPVLPDLDSFINVYFLTADGTPNYSKTRYPLALENFHDFDAVHRKAAQIPGFVTCIGGQDDLRTVCVGWNKSQVEAEAKKFDDMFTLRKNKESLMFSNPLSEHKALVDKIVITGLRPHQDTNSKTPITLQNIIGSYVVRCYQLLDRDDSPEDRPLTMDITATIDRFLGMANKAISPPDIMEAAVDLGVMKGTMLMSLSETRLAEYVESLHVPRQHSGDSDGSEGKKGKSKGKLATDRASKKPKTQSVAPTTEKESDSATDTTTQPAFSPIDLTSGKTRIYFQLHGRNTQNSAVDFSPHQGKIYPHSQRGYLDFTDDTFTSFTCTLDMPGIGRGMSLEGFKVDAKVRREGESWRYWVMAAAFSPETSLMPALFMKCPDIRDSALGLLYYDIL